MNNILLVVAGPTASGKTALSIRLARYFNTEIVSADARQFYRELNIGVGRPLPEQLQQVPHHFVGHLSIHQPYSAGAFEHDALALLEQLFQQHRVVVLTGGSGLFLRAVTDGLDRFPPVPASIMEQLNEQYRKRGIAFLQDELRLRDPVYYELVDRSNPQRLLRALGVCYAAGKPYSVYRQSLTHPRPFRVIKFALSLPREQLKENIHRRIDWMLHHGWLEEAAGLLPYRHLNALRTVGYPQLFQYLMGWSSWDDAVREIRQKTWQYARRQLTWLRADTAMQAVAPDDDEVIRKAVEHVLH